MSNKISQAWIPNEILKKVDNLKVSSKIAYRTDAFKIMGQMNPIIEKVETKRLPKSKKKQIVIFGKWVFEL